MGTYIDRLGSITTWQCEIPIVSKLPKNCPGDCPFKIRPTVVNYPGWHQLADVPKKLAIRGEVETTIRPFPQPRVSGSKNSKAINPNMDCTSDPIPKRCNTHHKVTETADADHGNVTRENITLCHPVLPSTESVCHAALETSPQSYVTTQQYINFSTNGVPRNN